MAIDRAHERLFVGCHNKLMVVMDATTGRVIATLPIGGGVDGTAFDPKLGLAFSANGEGTLTVVKEENPDHFRRVADVPTQRGARTLALDEKGHRVFVVTAQFGETPSPTAEHPHPRSPQVPGTFAVLIYGP